MAADTPESTEARLHGFSTAQDPERLHARDRLEVIVSRFADEARRGLRPSVEDYARRYWDVAAELRELLPLVANLERWKNDKEGECVRENLLPFDRLGPWKLIREIGRGGMGIVFEAEGDTGNRVAVKLLPIRYTADAERRKSQLRHEASTIARLRHKSIVPVYSFGEHEGYSFYAMQLVTGMSLADLIHRLRESPEPVSLGDLQKNRASLFPFQRNSWVKFAKLAGQVSLALEYAHSQQVIHHDIKPGNLLLDAAGHVLVSDFGVGAPQVVGELSSDHDWGPATLRYMAPERMHTRGDARSDVYSLGATLYELSTQAQAFEAGERVELIDRILYGKIRPPRSIRPDMPRDLETIILKALSREPEDRYATARLFAADLMRFVNGEPIQARRPSFLSQALRNYVRRFGAKPSRGRNKSK